MSSVSQSGVLLDIHDGNDDGIAFSIGNGNGIGNGIGIGIIGIDNIHIGIIGIGSIGIGISIIGICILIWVHVKLALQKLHSKNSTPKQHSIIALQNFGVQKIRLYNNSLVVPGDHP